MKKVAILQSNYLPWRGYFDLINSVDEFIIYDDMQYTKRDWRNRNKVKGRSGLEWITVPVNVKGKFEQKIKDTQISSPAWAKNHLNTFQHCYSKASYFDDTFELLSYHMRHEYDTISQLNVSLLKVICNVLDINTQITYSWDYSLAGEKTERLANLSKQAEANIYVSGPSAKSYMEIDKFKDIGIDVEWFSYDKYPEYTQLWGNFENSVSIVDVLFNCGPKAKNFISKI